MRALIFLAFCIISVCKTNGQVLEKFSFSKCISESNSDSTKIDSINQTGNLLEIHLTAYANCIGNFEGQIAISNDTLDLQYTIRLTRIVNKKTGEVEEFLKKFLRLPFKFVYTIRGVSSLSKRRIQINGETVDEINKRIPEQEPVQAESIIRDPNWSSEGIFNIVEYSAEFPEAFRNIKSIYPKI